MLHFSISAHYEVCDFAGILQLWGWMKAWHAIKMTLKLAKCFWKPFFGEKLFTIFRLTNSTYRCVNYASTYFIDGKCTYLISIQTLKNQFSKYVLKTMIQSICPKLVQIQQLLVWFSAVPHIYIYEKVYYILKN